MKRDIINLIMILILKMFSKVKINYKAQINPSVFKYLLKIKDKNINIRVAKLSTGPVLSEGVQFFDSPEIFGNIIIGKYTSICGPSTRICAKVNKIVIGNFCSIASNVIIQEYYHNLNKTTTYNIFGNIFKTNLNEAISKGDIIIEDDVWIGSNVSILSGITIGRGAVIGAGSVVTKDIPAYSIAAGNPCKVIKQRFNIETINYLESCKWWEWDLVKIKANSNFFNELRT